MTSSLRMRAVVCLASFCLGLLSTGVAPVMAQTAAATVSPDARASDTMWQNPYYRAMNTPYYNPALNPYGNSAYANTAYGNAYGNTYLANTSASGTGSYVNGYYNGYAATVNNQGLNTANQRYASMYGNRFQPGYYGATGQGGYGQGYQLPGLLGAVAGLAIGASTFGVWGAVIGGIGGYLLGKTIGNYILPAGLGTNYGVQQSMTPLMVGAVGALAGAWALKFLGPMGWVIGGTLGFVMAQWMTRTLAPNFYYYGFQRPGTYPPYANQNAYYYAPGTTEPQVGEAVTPTAAVVTTPVKASDTLSDLQEKFYDAMRTYKTALSGSDAAAQEAARAEYMSTRDAYMKAKEVPAE